MLNGNVIVDGRPYSVGNRGLSLIYKIIKLNSWLEKAEQPTLEFTIAGQAVSTTRKTEFERE